MTNEEIDAEIEKLQALKAQNNKAQTTENNKPADGIHNPADYINKIARAMDDQSLDYDRGRGDNFSSNLEVAKDAGRRTGFEQDDDGTPLPETAYEWILQQMHKSRARGPISKYTLDAIENGAKLRYNLPGDFDLSGKGFLSGNTHENLAKAMNSMPYNYNYKPQTPTSTPTNTPTNTQGTQNTTKTEYKPKGKQVPNTNKGVAGAEVGDHIIRSDGSIYVLNLGDINWAKKKTARQTQSIDENTVSGTEAQLKADIANGYVKPTYNENSIIGATKEELDFMKTQGLSDDLYNKGMQAIRNGNGLTDEEKQFIQQYEKASGSRKPIDRAFLTPENAKRYTDLIRRRKAAKKVQKK